MRRLLMTVLIFNFSTAFAQPLCSEFFRLDTSTGYRPKPESFSPSSLKKNVDARELRRFKGDEGSLALLGKHPERNDPMSHATIADQLLYLTLGVSFNSIAGIKGSIDFFKGNDSKLLLKALRGDWGATQELYRLLTLLSRWINEAHPNSPAVDLTLKQDMLRYLNLVPGDQLSARWKAVAKSYYVHNSRQLDILAASPISTKSQVDDLIYKAREMYHGSEYKELLKPAGVGAYVVRKTSAEYYELLSSWVRQLHFTEEVTQRYLLDLRTILENPTVRNSKMAQAEKLRLHVSMLRYFNFHILNRRLPDHFSDKELKTTRFSELARIQFTIREFDAFYTRQEILLEQALVGIQTLNAQVDGLEQRLNWAKQETDGLPLELAVPWRDRFEKAIERATQLRSQELSPEEWLRHQAEFEVETFATEKLLQEWSRQKQRVDITYFSQLNFQWDLLVPFKAYKVTGLDYESVVFTSDVVDFFQKNLERGSYFLAAFSKGYVAHQNSSGLRKINAIHPEFRDIKLLKHGGKVRIVGRLVGRTIYFFMIYDQDRAYDMVEMQRAIQKFRVP